MSLSIFRAWVSLVAGVRRFLAPLLLCCLALHARAERFSVQRFEEGFGAVLTDTLVNPARDDRAGSPVRTL